MKKKQKKSLQTMEEEEQIAWDQCLLSDIQPQGGISFRGDRYIVTGSGYETCIHIFEFPKKVTDRWMSYVSNMKDTVVVIDISTEDVIQVKKNLNKSMKEQNYRFQQANDYEERYDAQQ
ncbi:MAG: hypothetical protein MJ116_10395, partial [Lachnospiraceae bacterium]|nr:hypothetical protein [Lachnospiraceae bacterium]